MIDVVVVNWNSGALLGRCLASLERNHRDAVRKVLVIDNASADRSLDDALRFKSDSFEYQIVRNAGNEGFAAACNKGAASCGSDFVLFLNPDCEIYASTLRDMLAEMRGLPVSEYAVFGIQLVGPDGSVARGCARQPRPAHWWVKLLGIDRLTAGRIRSHVMSEWPHAESRDVEHVIGAFYLVRRAVFESLGGFDERFFVYLEDLDFSRRALQAGYRIRYLSAARAYHMGGGTSNRVKARRLYYSLASRILFGFKHFSRAEAWALLAGTLVLEPLVRLGYSIARLEVAEARETAKGCLLLWRRLLPLVASLRRG